MMGEKIPIVFFPRFTTLAGDGITYWSQPTDMLPFDTFLLTFYRGPVMGGGAVTFEFYMEHSSDLIHWSEYTPSFDPSPGANVEGWTDKTGGLGERYFRVGVKLGGASPSATLWALGWASRTQS